MTKLTVTATHDEIEPMTKDGFGLCYFFVDISCEIGSVTLQYVAQNGMSICEDEYNFVDDRDLFDLIQEEYKIENIVNERLGEQKEIVITNNLI